jgi:HEPN pEK499 p136
MTLPRYHDQPVLLLIDRTLQNLEFIDRHKRQDGPFEVTQLINSFLTVIAHPWAQLLDQNKLKQVKLESKVFRECEFPEFRSLTITGEPAEIESVYDLLRVLRNGMAHGNIELLSRNALRNLRQTGPLPRVQGDEIAGIKLCNRKPKEDVITWCTALGIYELRQIVPAMMRLCQKRSLWKEEILLLQAQRDAARRARQA